MGDLPGSEVLDLEKNLRLSLLIYRSFEFMSPFSHGRPSPAVTETLLAYGVE